MKERYIGTKIVEAEPAWRVNGSIIISMDATVPANMEKEAGYKVVYEGGYESWSPEDVFERAYRRTDGLNFGLALEAAKMGKRIARKGWNGKNQYVILGRNFAYTSPDNRNPAAFHEDIGSKALVFVGTRGSQVGWLASQADMMADDWCIVE